MFLKDAVEPLLEAASNIQHNVPHHDLISRIISIDEQFIAEAWNKALLRSRDDPEAAITSNVMLMEQAKKKKLSPPLDTHHLLSIFQARCVVFCFKHITYQRTKKYNDIYNSIL